MISKKTLMLIVGLVFVAVAITGVHLLGDDKQVNNHTEQLPHGEREKTAWDLVEAMFYEPLDNNAVQCRLCFRDCVIREGQRGFCRNRENIGGVLYSLVYEKASAALIDPVEKEPMHHYKPGTYIFCVATVSCNLRCKFCHNWQLSQIPIEEAMYTRALTATQVVTMARDRGAPSISFTYNEPTVFYEYMLDIAIAAQEANMGVIFHTNGMMNPKPLQKLLQYVDAVTVDLKAFTDEFYQDVCEAKLQPVLDSLKLIKQEGVWLEIVNLIIPALNDDMDDIEAMCRWIVEHLGPEVPVHFSRFFPAYQMTRLEPTPIETLERAHAVAKRQGLHYVTIGNVPGHKYNSTYCPNCDERVIFRQHFSILGNELDQGSCRFCGYKLPGIWE